MEFKINGEELLRKIVKPANGTTGRIYLPKKWIGHEVAVVLLEKAKK